MPRFLTIGDLARRTGLTVKTIRFYADRGIVPPTDRSPAGHRLYAPDAVARLDLVRTLRELGLDLATIRRVLAREVTLPEVAAAHAEALDVQIRALRLRRGVLAAVARGGTAPKELELMRDLAALSADERRHLIDDFLADVFGGLDGFEGITRTLTPSLSDDPDAAQVEAWIELAGLTRDAGFRAALRRVAEQHDTSTLRRDPVAVVRDEAGPALAAGIDPSSPAAGPVVAAVLAHYPHRDRLLAQVEAAADPRRERYLTLLSVINGWAPTPSLLPVLTWFRTALA